MNALVFLLFPALVFFSSNFLLWTRCSVIVCFMIRGLARFQVRGPDCQSSAVVGTRCQEARDSVSVRVFASHGSYTCASALECVIEPVSDTKEDH